MFYIKFYSEGTKHIVQLSPSGLNSLLNGSEFPQNTHAYVPFSLPSVCLLIWKDIVMSLTAHKQF